MNWKRIASGIGIASLIGSGAVLVHYYPLYHSQHPAPLPPEGTLEYLAQFVKNMGVLGKHVENDRNYIPKNKEHYDLEIKTRHQRFKNNQHQLVYFPQANALWLKIIWVKRDIKEGGRDSLCHSSPTASDQGWIDITDNNLDLKFSKEDIYFACMHYWTAEIKSKYSTLVTPEEAEKLLARAIKEVVQREK